jgi:hypothetical protein
MKYMNLFTLLALIVIVVSIIIFRDINMKQHQRVYYSINKNYKTDSTIIVSPYSHGIESPYNHDMEIIPTKIPISYVGPDNKTIETFWTKLAFSAIFCIAALYVILSKKYDDETKKWAFSVLVSFPFFRSTWV